VTWAVPLGKVCGVYVITNDVTGAKYVGSSTDVKKRLSVHLRGLKQASHTISKMAEDAAAFGSESFSCCVLKECGIDKLVAEEYAAIALLKPEYNTITKQPCHDDARPNAGGYQSAATDEAIRQRKLGKSIRAAAKAAGVAPSTLMRALRRISQAKERP
jgi:group I intron endonuclease